MEESCITYNLGSRTRTLGTSFCSGKGKVDASTRLHMEVVQDFVHSQLQPSPCLGGKLGQERGRLGSVASPLSSPNI